MLMKAKTLVLGALLALGSLSLSLSSAGCDDVETAFDCNAVCNRYKECYQSDYDVGTCRSNCRANADRDPNVRAKADACESCIDDKSCLSASFSCSTECAGIVP